MVIQLGTWSTIDDFHNRKADGSRHFSTMFIKGLAGLNQSGLRQVFTLADHRLIHVRKTTKDTQEVAKTMEKKQLE